MKSLDAEQAKRQALLAERKQAMEAGETDLYLQKDDELKALDKKEIMEVLDQFQQSQDAAVLIQRGVRTLTAEETKYYESIIKALDSPDPRQAVAGLDSTIPQTIIETVFNDLAQEYPILKHVDFMYTPSNVKMIYNKTGALKAKWGGLTAGVTEELSGAVDAVETGKFNLSAYIYVSKPMIVLGAPWIDSYVRSILKDALAFGLEDGFVNGTGLNEPIGMIRSMATFDTSTGYPAKVASKIANLSIQQLGPQVMKLKFHSGTRRRPARQMFFAYSPGDEVKVLAARKVLGPMGYIDVVAPNYNIKFVECASLERGTAILGISKQYLGTLAGNEGGELEFSDHFKFLDQNRTYMIHLLGNGIPKDETSFVVLDISDLAPFVPQVNTDVSVEVTVPELQQPVAITGSVNVEPGEDPLKTIAVVEDGEGGDPEGV